MCASNAWMTIVTSHRKVDFMRSIEVVRLTDAHATENGLYILRTKCSNANSVKWTPRLQAAWEAALAVRAQTLARRANQRRPIPIRSEQRFIFLTESDTPLTRAGLDNAWQDLITAPIEAEVIAREQRFTLHGLKHREIRIRGKESGEEGGERPLDRRDARPVCG